MLQHDIAQTLQIVQDVLNVTVTQHQTEEVPDQEWVNAMKVHSLTHSLAPSLPPSLAPSLRRNKVYLLICPLIWLLLQDSYQPTEVCKGLWIVPDWCETPDPSALNIRMAPGLAFGTGGLAQASTVELYP